MSELRTAPSRPYSRRTDSALLRLEQVLERVALGKTQLYALLAAGKFPRPIQIGQRSVRWHAGDILAWIDAKRVPADEQLSSGDSSRGVVPYRDSLMSLE